MAEGASMAASAAEAGAEFGRVAAAFVETAERMLASGGAAGADMAHLAAALTAAMKLYAVRAEGEAAPPAPVLSDRITPTEVVVVVSETMRAVDLNLFDLSMWYRRAR